MDGQKLLYDFFILRYLIWRIATIVLMTRYFLARLYIHCIFLINIYIYCIYIYCIYIYCNIHSLSFFYTKNIVYLINYNIALL